MRAGPIACTLSHADTRAKEQRSLRHDSARDVVELVRAQAVDDIDGTELDSGWPCAQRDREQVRCMQQQMSSCAAHGSKG